MAEPTADNINPTSAPADTPAASGTQATPAPGAGEDLAAIKSQLDAVLKHKQALENDLKKLRDAKKERDEIAAKEKADAEAKLKEAGDFAKLHLLEKEKAAALEAQVAELAPKAERLTAHEKRVAAKLEAAKAKGDLPSYIVRAIDAAAVRDVDEAAEILDEFRASQSVAAPKQPAPPAPIQGAAPPTPKSTKRLEDYTTAELEQLRRTDKAAHDALIGAVAPKAGRSFGSWFQGRN